MYKLNSKHLSWDTPKLCPRLINPFQVVQVLSPVAYKLKLPSSMKCHPVFHISLIRPTDTESALFPEREQPAPPPVRVDINQGYFTIDYIMVHEPKTARSHEEAKKHLIKWEGTPLWEATKEPAKNIHKDVPHVVEDYWTDRSQNSFFTDPQQPSSSHRSSPQQHAQDSSHSQVQDFQQPTEDSQSLEV